MVAIITDKFKRQVLNDIFTNVVDSAATYYIGIGRSNDWNATDVAPTPLNTAKEERDFRLNLQSESKKVFLLEINTQPGLTQNSLFPRIAKNSGLEFPDLVEWIIKDAGVNR